MCRSVVGRLASGRRGRFEHAVDAGDREVSHEKSTGTGFFLWRPDPHEPNCSQFVLVTAAHVFENIPGNEATLFFRTKEAEGVYQKLPMKLVIRKDGKPRWTKHPSQDVAALVIVPPDKADLPKLSVDLLATDRELKKYRVHPGDLLSCLGLSASSRGKRGRFPDPPQRSRGQLPTFPHQGQQDVSSQHEHV
ncbi:MAG: hypothetical protein ACYC3I_00360 [Gemmataceae bacterium]